MTKVSNEIIIESYQRLRNVWRVGEEVGLSGQHVHVRIKKLGIKTNNPRFTDKEKQVLIDEYIKYRDLGQLQKLAKKLKRTKQFICRKAKGLGLTDQNRPYKKRKPNRNYNKENHPNWKGGVKENRTTIYNTYAKKLAYADIVRREPLNHELLQVKCAYCGKWYSPTLDEVIRRINGLEGHLDTRIYCSEGCKQQCPVYRKSKYPKDFRKGTSREVVPELRQLVFKRDNYKCQKCGSTKSLNCHHIKGYAQYKILANDPDNCITLCKKCHREVHKLPGCGYVDLKCK